LSAGPGSENCPGRLLSVHGRGSGAPVVRACQQATRRAFSKPPRCVTSYRRRSPLEQRQPRSVAVPARRFSRRYTWHNCCWARHGAWRRQLLAVVPSGNVFSRRVDARGRRERSDTIVRGLEHASCARAMVAPPLLIYRSLWIRRNHRHRRCPRTMRAQPPSCVQLLCRCQQGSFLPNIIASRHAVCGERPRCAKVLFASTCTGASRIHGAASCLCRAWLRGCG
jgi:hypothetical protein